MSEKPEDSKEKIKSIEKNKFRKQAREDSLNRARKSWGISPPTREEKIKSIEDNPIRDITREESLKRARKAWGDVPEVVEVDLLGKPVKPEVKPKNQNYLPPHERDYHGLDPKKRGNNNR